LPSEYIRQHIRLSSQPLPDLPGGAKDMPTYLEWLHAEDTLLFASDYPHWDWDEPRNFLTGIDPILRDRIMGGNAVELYGFE
jgi:predicted TIM-barrel fold metal-dependent hydrolase